MQFYRAEGFTTNENWEEIYNDRRKMRESVRKIARNSTAFNGKLQKQAFFFVSDVSEDIVVIGALYEGGRDIGQQFAAFLGTVELELKDLRIEEVTFNTACNMLRMADGNNYIVDDDDYILDRKSVV